MRQCSILVSIIIVCFSVLAADPTEKNVPTSTLAIYSGGFEVGAIRSLTDSLRTESQRFFKLAFINEVHFNENVYLFADIDWLAPSRNFGVEVGIDCFLSSSPFRPFIGGGAGVRLFDKKGYRFGDNIGPSATLHGGFLFDLSKYVQLRVRTPFHVVFNKTNDMGAGLDIGILFSNPYRQVRQLNY